MSFRGLQDTDDVDFLLSMSMSEFGNCIMQLVATIIFIAVVQVRAWGPKLAGGERRLAGSWRTA
jgi:hypothetical protein